MKKKILTSFIAFFILSSFSYGADFDLETSVTFPLEVSAIDTGVNVGLNVGADYMFNDFAGIGFGLSAYTPIYGLGFVLNNNVINVYYVNGFLSKVFDFRLEAFTGASLRVFSDKKLNIILTPGVDVNYKYVNDNMERGVISFSFGVGLDNRITYDFTDKIAFNAGLLTDFSFFETGDINGVTFGFFPQGFRFTPRIGAVFSF